MNIQDLLDSAEIVVKAEQDDTPVRGNASVSGDDAADREIEDAVIARLDAGDVWAWAWVEVYAEVHTDEHGTVTSDSDNLGCCSYADEADFRAAGDYFDDMKRTALASLEEKLRELIPQPILRAEIDGSEVDSANHEPGEELSVRIVNDDAESGVNECAGPLDWFNSARVTADPDEDAIHFVLSIDDPRGGLCFTVRRIPGGDHKGQLVIHVPHPQGTMQHVDVAQDHPGTLVVVDKRHGGSPRTF